MRLLISICRRLTLRLVAAVAFALSAACGPHPLKLPEGPGSPLPGYPAIFERLTSVCRGVRTMTAELALSGRTAGTKLRGRVLAGLAEPGSLRLEGVAPFGPPAFVFAARPGEALLLLPRDERVVRGARAVDILEALAGVPLGPDDLRAILTGCVAPAPVATGGTVYGPEWAAIALEGDATLFIRPAPSVTHPGTGSAQPAPSAASGNTRAPQLVAARVGTLTIEYGEIIDGLPRRVRLLVPAGDRRSSVETDLTVTLSQIEINTTIDSDAFTIEVPAGAVPLTIDELRDAGPLGGAARRRSGRVTR